MNRIFKNKITGILATILLFLVATTIILGLSYAARVINIESSTTNLISTKSLNGRIVEEYEEPTGVMPGQSVEKIVNIENTGSIPALVRAKTVKQCGYSRDENNNIVIDNNIDVNKINITYDETTWKDGEDGYYYYTDILNPGENTKTPLFREYTIDKTAGNEYKNAKCDILVNAEIIQATGNSAPQIWNKSYSFLEIEAPDGYGLSAKKVTFTINKSNYSQDLQLEMINTQDQKPYVSVTKQIKKSDIVYDHGEATFIFKLTGTDLNDKNHEYYRTVTFKQSVVDSQNSEYVSLTTIFKELESGTYTLSEESVNRYQLEQINNVSSSGTVRGTEVIFDLSNDAGGKATFVNKKILQTGLSHTDVITNIISKSS